MAEMARKTLQLDMNRVEGDLRFELELEGGQVAEARCVGKLYRGFEQIMLGRHPKDALVITPRICGICGTAHLYAAVLALEQIATLPVPPNATRVRNLCLMAETAQNDLRQSFLFFAPDFCHARYAAFDWHATACAQFQPFHGKLFLEALEHSRQIVKLVAIFGGQWPHSSYMLPGGVTAEVNAKRVLDCKAILSRVTRWFEASVLGCGLEEWLALEHADALFAKLETEPAARGALALLTRLSHSTGLHGQAKGVPCLLSYGAYLQPEIESVADYALQAGFLDGDSSVIQPFEQAHIAEHVRHSWYQPYEGGKHPFQGQTIPHYQPTSDRYSWAKAPRYQGKAVQTGPLAELLIGGEKLVQALYAQEGGGSWLRQFARLRRTARLLDGMRQILAELAAHLGEAHYLPPPSHELPDGEGYGLVSAARGGLGHWVRVENNAVSQYQIIPPTAWNASPKDASGQRGHWEQSLLGLAVADPGDPIEIQHAIRSHDPCLVCTVHLLGAGKTLTLWP
jgi:hydrogenase large subunit